ncbi:hypothetical protein [Sphingomonas morindae]|uniref:Uncharacterized protein n=1 Tax=Sphingomonas morindae TaxID=1541170 RepID=A0ABY4X9Z7_9SPHN|nr:hypothetical protein [Sphingomonas morindae]USI73797.1 hypothetical protein LHA26_04835 [Sphingomonas morindae]
MYLDPFEGPFLKLERAGKHLIELVEAVRAYQALAHPEFIHRGRAEDPWEIALSEKVPPEISLILGDIAHSLRSALDVMTCDIARVRKVGVSDMSFPFTDSEESFKAKLSVSPKSAPFLKLGKDVVSMIEAAQPYKGGNDLLRGLHDLNNHDKHRTAVPLVQFISTSFNPGVKWSREMGVNLIYQSGILMGLGVGEPISHERYLSHPADSITINKDAMIITFPPGYFLTGSILETMENLVNAVFSLVERFKEAVLPA